MAGLEQHFLVDPAALRWIVARLDPRPGERAVELGAGAGTIAAALRRRVAAHDLTLVELDGALAGRLTRALPGVAVVAGDWRAAWPDLGPIDLLVVSLPHALVPAALAAAAAHPPRVTLVAFDAARPPALPASFRRSAARRLPRGAFRPPQPFEGEAWVLRPAPSAEASATVA